MSLVKFKAQNHPQQISKPSVDDRALPSEDFSVLMKRFSFSVDAAAAPHNAKLPRFWTVEDDGLKQSWATERVYCNPPYSNIRPWVEKAVSEPFSPIILLLLPANRTEQGWWQDLIEPMRNTPNSRLTIEFVRGRRRFINSGKTSVQPNDRPPFGICYCIFKPTIRFF